MRLDDIGTAYFEMAAARRAGDEFAAMFLIADPRGSYAYDVAPKVLRAGDYDRQRVIFDAIAAGTVEVNGRLLSEVNAPNPQLRVALSDLSRLPDMLVVRSWRDAEVQRELRGWPHSNVARWYPARALGAWEPASHRDLVVIWAPEYQAERTAIHTFALHGLHAELVVISYGGIPQSQRARYVDIDSPVVPAILARAACVVDTSLDDPSWAQALAARGVSLAVSATSGAYEVAEGVAVYEPWSHESIWSATLKAMGRRASRARESPPPSEVISHSLEAARPRTPERPPLVSVIVPTFNRRSELLRILRKLQEQTYENFEVIVVNDGGEPVADLAAVDSRIKVFDREKNVGIFGALNFGLQQARGEWIQAEADDDELYPDHLVRLVEAGERTGAGVVHSNVLIRYESESDGALETTGYNSSIFCFPLDRTEVYAASPVAGNAQLVRRDVFERVGGFDESFILADQEIQIRLSEITDFVHVPRVTAEWLVRRSGQQFSAKKQGAVLDDIRRVFERHPAIGRDYVTKLRERTLTIIAGRPPGIPFEPVIQRVPVGTPKE